MGVLDQAARYAAQADPEAAVGRILRGVRVSFRFRAWVDTRTTPRPGQRNRTADRVAELVDGGAPDRPWLLVFEFQAQHDPDKLDVTLVEAGQLRLEARHGEDRRGKYNILVALVYLRGSCPEPTLDMTLPGGWGPGTRRCCGTWSLPGGLSPGPMHCRSGTWSNRSLSGSGPPRHAARGDWRRGVRISC
jgi:hypothetical protein